MIDISFVMPGIRTHNWPAVVDSIAKSCTRYTYEIIFAGPFDPPGGLPCTKYIKTYTRPSAACQIAAAAATGRLYNGTADDALFIPNAVDAAIDLYDSLNNKKAIINMRYTEGDNYSGSTFPESFWSPHSHQPLALPGVPVHYKTCMSPMMDREYYIELGGLDCAYEYPNFNLSDFIFRAQYDGATVHHSPTDVNNCNHYGNRSVDHAPIEDAHVIDMALFRNKYSNPNALQDHGARIPFDNWKNYQQPWERRFSGKLFSNYNEMLGI